MGILLENNINNLRRGAFNVVCTNLGGGGGGFKSPIHSIVYNMQKGGGGPDTM